MSDGNREEKVLQGLKERAPGDVLTAEEVEVLQKIVKVYRGLTALGWIGSSVRNVILVVMTIVGAYAALTGALAEWIKKVSGTG